MILVEKSGKSLFGSAVSGEGFVNVYKGTGRVLMSPVGKTTLLNNMQAQTADNSPSSSKGEKVSSAIGIAGEILEAALDAID